MKHRMLLALAVLVAASSRAHAAPGSIVVEAYDGERPADASTLLAPVYAELEQRGYLGGDKLAWQVRTQVSADPGALSPGQIVDAEKDVERAYQALVDGDYAKASASAQKALAVYASAPAVLARADALRALDFKALVIAARSEQVLGHNDDAFRWMAEAVRAFAQAPSATDFDPSVIGLYRSVAGELKKQGDGSLDVQVDDAAVTLFLDERFVGSGQVKLDAVAPGKYRLLLVKGNQTGRVHVIDVPPRGKASTAISWGLDVALSTDRDRVVVAGHGDDLTSALLVGRAMGARRVIVLGVGEVGGRRAIVGRALDVESQRRSYAAVQIEPLAPPEETLRRLAALLAGDDNVSSSNLITREPSTVAAKSGLGGRRITALVVAGTAVVAGGAALGFDLYAHDAYDASTREGNNTKQNDLFETSNRRYHIAQGLAVASLVGVAAAATLWFTSPSSTEQPDRTVLAPVVSPGEVGFTISGRF